jgi:hypothetical protein
MQKLGHHNIQSTQIYTHLVNFEDDEWIVKVAHNVDEVCNLVKVSFQYVTGDYTDGEKIFRKRE